MKKVILFTLIFFYSNLVLAKNTYVLFIGNSYTYAHDMPQMIGKIAKSDPNIGTDIIVEQVTKGGAKLIGHWNDKEALSKIQSRNWDFVVFQEQSTWALYKFDYENSYRVAPKFKNASASSVKNKILFVTWPRKPHSNWYRGDTGKFFKNANYMQNELNRRSEKLASYLGASQMKVGDYWKFMNKKYPKIDLYEKDNSHPSLAGSYFNALLFYKVFSKSKNIANLTYAPSGLKEEDAQLLRMIVAG